MRQRQDSTYNLIFRSLMPTLWLAILAFIIYHWAGGSGSSLLESGPDFMIAIGSLFGLIAAYLALTQLILQSRLPLIEQPFGRASLVKLHKLGGYATIITLILHADLVTVGYAWSNEISPITQYIQFATSYPYVIWAMIALALFVTIVALSITIVRRRLRYETWYWTHLLTYLAILLAFNHQLAVGIDFASASDNFMRAVWWSLYIITFLSVLIFRVGRPLLNSWRYNLHVERVESETPDVYSIYVGGRGLDRLVYDPGQFMIWRFLDRKRWWQSHPFTISQAMDGQYLRLTFKAVGDFTRELASVRPGTRVIADGPYGDFTLDHATGAKVLFVAGGIGLTPLRAMAERLPAGTDGVFVYAARTPTDLALRQELEAIAVRTGLRLHLLVGEGESPSVERGILDTATLQRLVPDAATRDAFVCGPPPMMAAVSTSLRELGTPSGRIHTERFAF